MLFSANQQMAQALEQAQASYTLKIGPGEHDWVFWDEWIQEVLAWLPILKQRKQFSLFILKANPWFVGHFD